MLQRQCCEMRILLHQFAHLLWQGLAPYRLCWLRRQKVEMVQGTY